MRRVYTAIVLTFVLCATATLRSESPTDRTDLATFLNRVLLDAPKSKLPTAEESARVLDQIPLSSPESLKRAVPELESTLHSSDPSIKRLGIISIYCVDQRPDSESLMRSLVPSLLSLLNDGEPDVAALAVRSIFSMKPKPPQGVVGPFVSYLEGNGAANVVGATIVFALARIAPDSSSAGEAVNQFLRRIDLPTEIRVACHNALALRGLKNQKMVSGAAQDIVASQNEEVRLAAIHAISVIGPNAVETAKPQLTQLANDGNQSANLRQAALDALGGRIATETPQ